MGFGVGLRKRERTTAAPSILRSLQKGRSGGKIRRVNEKDLKRADKKDVSSNRRQSTAADSLAESGKYSASISGVKSARIQGDAIKKLQHARVSNREVVRNNASTSESDHYAGEASTSVNAMAVGRDTGSADGYSSRKRLKHKQLQQKMHSRVKSPINQQELYSSVRMAKQRKLPDNDLMTNDQRKKKKRVIQIDPYDISNKRIDESVPTSTEKDKDVEKYDVKLSKNMQLRIIKPSLSALSFVEDNLLGRRRMVELKKAGYNVDLSVPLDNIPFSTSKEHSRIEENVFRNKMEFFAAAKVSSSFPPPILPEIAFAGISNVGKSSLLNALTRQWGVARTSDKPGHTQTINFFRLASKLCLVDLPGYGFAYAKTEVKEAWGDLVMEYVSTRESLQRVCLLIDTKRGMKSYDHELIDLMERSRTPFQVVLTKTDLVFPIDVARRATQVQQDLETRKSIIQPVMMVSSKSGGGIRSLRMVLSKLARFARV